ncbi:MAG TPA: histidine phosphatase family protein, partial [Longimicrobium sp.]
MTARIAAAARHAPGARDGAGQGADVEAPATVLYLVRHGETAWNRTGRLQGSRDLPLNEAGRRQAAALAEHFRARSISAAYSSPLRRARETAGAILAGRDVPVQVLPDLAEMRCGAWEGLDAAERERR